LFILTSILPSVATAAASREKIVPVALIDAASWISENSPKNSLVLTQSAWGAIIEAVGNRPVYADDDIISSPDYSERISNAQEALAGDNSILTDEHIDYVIAPNLKEDRCLHNVYGNEVNIAKVLC